MGGAVGLYKLSKNKKFTTERKIKMSLPQVGKIYTFTCMVFPDKRLNLCGSAGNGGNVAMINADENEITIEEQWKYHSSGKLLAMKNTSCVLDRYAASGTQYNNADVWVNDPQEDANQIIAFEETIFPNTVKIRLASTNLYLRANAGNGTSGGKSTTSAGNAYWGVSTGEDNELWVFSEVGATSGDEDDTTEESDYSTGYYRFSNGGYYLTGTTNSVTAAAVNGQTTQTWNFSNNKLYTESSSSYGIAGTSSATMSTSPNSVVLVWAGTNKCYIKLSGSNKYLQRSSTTVSWGTSPVEWTIEEIIKKTGTPHYAPEYFSARAGESNGAWDATRTANLKLLFKKFYLDHSGSVSDARIGQNLYGALYFVDDPEVKGKFHTGIDFNDDITTEIYSPIDGYIVNCNQDNGAICIYNQENNYTLVLMHLKINDTIKNIENDTPSDANFIREGTLMGIQSGYFEGDPEAFDPHLHFEFHNGKYTGDGAGLPSKSYDAIGSTVNPYDKIAAIVS